MPAFPDGFAYLTGAMDQEELLLFALAKAPRPPGKQDLDQGVVLGILYVPSSTVSPPTSSARRLWGLVTGRDWAVIGSAGVAGTRC